MKKFINTRITVLLALVFVFVIIMGMINVNTSLPVAEISVDCEASVSVQSLLFTNEYHKATSSCEHLSELIAILQSMQSEVDYLPIASFSFQSEADYLPITPFSCSFGNCALVPVWVTISGVRVLGYLCTICSGVILV